MSEKLQIANPEFILSLIEDDYDLLNSMIEIFNSTHPVYSEQFYQYLQNSEFGKIGDLAHKAKATTSTFGMKEITKDLTLLEKIIKNKPNNILIKEIIDKFTSHCNIAEKELTDYTTKKLNHD